MPGSLGGAGPIGPDEPSRAGRQRNVNYPRCIVRTWLRLAIIALCAGLGLALGVVALALPVSALINHAASSQANVLPDITSQLSQRSVVYAADGTVLATFHAAENRVPVSIDTVPDSMVNAVLDTEDARFWSHGGFDVKSTVRALASDAKKGQAAQGGSTITQQLVKNTYLTSKRQVSRKVKEAIIAVRLERKYSKKQILEAYLNTVYFGNGAYGVQAAAETYFNENVGQITPVQAAFIAGMIQDPLGYDPLLNPGDSKARRDFVLDRMVTQRHLSADQAVKLKNVPIPTSVNRGQDSTDVKGYYVEQVKQILLNQSTTLGTTYTDRYNALFRAGLQIHTNLDPHLQSIAEQQIAQGIPSSPPGFAGALASIDPSNGKVRALVGGPGFDKYKYDLATQALRQPGSGFKLFTLLAAYEAGYGPYDSVDASSPCSVDFPDNHDLLKNPINNDEGKASGSTSVIQATAFSVNCAFVRIAHEVTLPKVIAMAHRLGISEKLNDYPSMVIGSQETTVLEMADAYATLANDGVYHKPAFIDYIADRNGKTIFKTDDPGKRVLDPQISRMAVATLQAVVQYGTGTGAALYDRPVAGKTGTSETNIDAWFNGITPQLTTSVWMGDPKQRTQMNPQHGFPFYVFGGTYPASIWHNYTQAALSGQPVIYFPAPDQSKIPGGRFIGPPPSCYSSTTANYGGTYYGNYCGTSTSSTLFKKRTTTSSSVPGGPTTLPPGTPPTGLPPPPPTTNPRFPPPSFPR
jgi:penicillin-binding protein 1A